LSQNTFGFDNTAIGVQALSFNNTGNENTAIGTFAMNDNRTGLQNVGLGIAALRSNVGGNNNVSLGAGSMISSINGSGNVAIGHYALDNLNGGNINIIDNVAIGRQAGREFTVPEKCVFVGAFSAAVGDGGKNMNSTMIGYDTYADKSFATALGSGAQVQGRNSTAIGANSFVFGENKLVLGSINGQNDATASTFVGIGTISPVCPLDVRGQNILGINNYNFHYYAYIGDGYASGTPQVSIRADSRMVASEFDAVSDGRIKNIKNRQDSAAALSKLNQLTVTNYTYKDILTNGSAPKIGFIAQEVEKILPNTVRKSTSEIPSIMQLPKSFCYDNENQELEITLEKPHGFSDNSTVKIFNAFEPFEQCARIITPNTFSIHFTDKNKTDKLFVYGEIVDDFRSVDYDQIHTLTVAAEQELSIQNNNFKSEIEILKSEVEKLKTNAQNIELLLQDVAELKKNLVPQLNKVN
jgi:Chaperone of endosialidase/Head domain of trimeric autotransporter adhesin